MYVTFATLALALAGNSPTTKWMDDYTAGYRQATTARKALAVVVGRGATGWQQLDAQQSLSDKYVFVYLDASLEKNKNLVQQLQTGDTGLVLSDSTGQYVAYRHVGAMTKDQLEGTIKRYSVEQQPAPTPAPVPAPVAGGVYPPGGCGTYGSCAMGNCGSYQGGCAKRNCGSSCVHRSCRSQSCSSSCGSQGHRLFSRGGCRGGSSCGSYGGCR